MWEGEKLSFTKLFYSHICFRQSCGVCHFCNLRRPSDITLADYWGWERTDPSFNADDKGCSLVLCNTKKGKELFDAVKGRMDTIPADLANIMQNHLSKPSEMHPSRLEFEHDYVKHGLVHSYKKFGLMKRHPILSAVKRKIEQVFHRICVS